MVDSALCPHLFVLTAQFCCCCCCLLLVMSALRQGGFVGPVQGQPGGDQADFLDRSGAGAIEMGGEERRTDERGREPAHEHANRPTKMGPECQKDKKGRSRFGVADACIHRSIGAHNLKYAQNIVLVFRLFTPSPFSLHPSLPLSPLLSPHPLTVHVLPCALGSSLPSRTKNKITIGRPATTGGVGRGQAIAEGDAKRLRAFLEAGVEASSSSSSLSGNGSGGG